MTAQIHPEARVAAGAVNGPHAAVVRAVPAEMLRRILPAQPAPLGVEGRA